MKNGSLILIVMYCLLFVVGQSIELISLIVDLRFLVKGIYFMTIVIRLLQ
jgi:hypothetical protein